METEEVVRRYADMVYRLAYAQTRAKSDADDIFQEVFLRYVRRAPVFESEEHRKAWLIRVTVNCAKSHWGSAWLRRTEPLTERIALAAPEDSGLDEALCRLPVKYRTVVHLYYFEGYTAEQIGTMLGRKPATVRTQLTRARKMLAKLLEEDTAYV